MSRVSSCHHLSHLCLCSCTGGLFLLVYFIRLQVCVLCSLTSVQMGNEEADGMACQVKQARLSFVAFSGTRAWCSCSHELKRLKNQSFWGFNVGRRHFLLLAFNGRAAHVPARYFGRVRLLLVFTCRPSSCLPYRWTLNFELSSLCSVCKAFLLSNHY